MLKLCLLALIMALNVDLRVLTQPGGTGNQTISLAANFDPKAIILWTSGLAAAGEGANAQFGFGFGTYRGSTVSQRFISVTNRDNQGVAVGNQEMETDALCVLHSTTAESRDLEIDLVSMQTGATSQVVINWANLFTTASIKVNCLILGGSDITDALVGHFSRSATVATQDVTVVTGFGQPDLLFMFSGWAAIGDGINPNPGAITIGFGKKGEAGRCFGYTAEEQTTMTVGMTQRSDLINRLLDNADQTVECAYSLDTTPGSTWPTDGFQINYDVQQPTSGEETCFLALKGTFSATTGAGSAPTAGELPVVQDLNHGSVPKLGFLFGWNLAVATTVNTTSTDLGAFFMGAGDGTVECLAGLSDDDGLGTSDCNKFWTDTKVVRNYNAAAALQSEADGSISGNNFRLSWNDIDSVAREYQWLTLGDAPVTAFELNAESGSYTITGVAATPLGDRLLRADPGSYVLTGAAATLTREFVLSADPGTYNITGAAATLLADRMLNAQAGAYTVTGAAAVLAAARLFSAEAGAYVITGAAAGLFKELILSADAGVYAISGAPAGLLADRMLDAQPGAYLITGAAATLLWDRLLRADPGSYLITGFDANLVYTPVSAAEFILIAEPGGYSVVGRSLRGVLEFDQFPAGDGEGGIFIINE